MTDVLDLKMLRNIHEPHQRMFIFYLIIPKNKN